MKAFRLIIIPQNPLVVINNALVRGCVCVFIPKHFLTGKLEREKERDKVRGSDNKTEFGGSPHSASPPQQAGKPDDQ